MEDDPIWTTVTLEKVQEAAKRIEGKAKKTPVLTSSTLDLKSGKELFFKCEIFQKVTLKRRTFFEKVLIHFFI